MGLSLRERFLKHSTGPSEDKVSSIASILSAPPTTANHVLTTTVKDNMADLTAPPPPPSYSPPPPPSELPRKPEKSLCSPSPSLLHRYKGRGSTENSADGSASAKKLAKTSPAPANVTTRSRSKVPSFTENFGYSKSATELTTPPRVASSTSINSTTRTVGGVEFEMLNPPQPSQGQPIRSRSAEPARARSAEKHAEDGETTKLHRKRESHSETRKVRADSANGDLDIDATKPQHATVTKPNPEAEKPRLKSILKKKEGSNPIIPDKLKIPRVTRSTTAADTAKNTKTNAGKKTVKLVDSSSDSDSSSSDSSDCEFILDNEPGTAAHSTQNPEPNVKPIKVIPPAYISGTLPGLVWMSPLSGTSRSDYPWAWCKRWTCCRCLASTIVEQEVCARLTCGHHRCGDLCMLEKVRRSQLMRVRGECSSISACKLVKEKGMRLM
jgi:hypothetical protein